MALTAKDNSSSSNKVAVSSDERNTKLAKGAMEECRRTGQPLVDGPADDVR